MGIVSTLVGAALDGLSEITREAIASSLRSVADRVEQGDLVSDTEIDALKESTSKIRDMLKRASSSPS